MGKRDGDVGGGMRVRTSGGGLGRSLARLTFTLLLLAAIVLSTGVLIVRGDGGREFIRGHLERRLGTELAIERTRIVWPYALRIEKLTTPEADDGARPGFKAREVRIAPTLRGGVRVDVYHGALNLAQDHEGAWAPTAFTRLGDLPDTNIGHVSRLTQSMRERVVLRVVDGSIRWVDADGRLLHAASGVSFSVEPAHVPGWRLYRHRLAVYSMTDAFGASTNDVACEWLASDLRPYIELSRSDRRPAPTTAGFWEAPE